MPRKTLPQTVADAHRVAAAAQALAEEAAAADLPYGVVARALRDAMRAAERERSRRRSAKPRSPLPVVTVGSFAEIEKMMSQLPNAIRVIGQHREDRAALLDDIDLSVRAANTCQAMGLRTVAELVNHSPTTLRAAGMAIKVIRELQGHLAARGRTLRVEAPGDKMILDGGAP